MGEYDDDDWEELPSEIQEAAKLLGYTEELWDKDREPAECDKSWKKLTTAQQEAATKLGYDQKAWDAS
jgi:hypothetical protein